MDNKKALLHTPEGVRDIYGDEYLRKLSCERLINESFHSYGYRDIQTPTFEFFDVFSREIGTTQSKDLYKFFDKEGNTLVLRPDFTPSIARCAAKYFSEDTEAIRLCYRGRAFSNTSQLQGKLREMTHMGCELMGDDSPEADAEVAALLIQSLLDAGLKEFQLSLGQVEYFKGICIQSGLSQEEEEKLRGFISVKNYFGAEAFLIEQGICEEYRTILLRAADLIGGIDILDGALELVRNKRAQEAVDRLRRIYDILKLYGLSRYVSFDLGMLSKYHYYTGLIMKAYTYGVGEAIASGGRYDGLLGYFGRPRPAMGFVIMVDHLLEAMARGHQPIGGMPEFTTLEYTKDSYQEVLLEALNRRARGENITLKAIK